ncbi:MAG: His/Gly/Thr/Pro-type tRNA ligase C-terminal domain-containing protein, partial [Candidatus Hodarchaeota archaeon]
ADEAGIPLCITVDYQTLEENSVTIRNRNSWEQARLKIENIESALLAYLDKTRSFDEIDQNPR